MCHFKLWFVIVGVKIKLYATFCVWILELYKHAYVLYHSGQYATTQYVYSDAGALNFRIFRIIHKWFWKNLKLKILLNW